MKQKNLPGKLFMQRGFGLDKGPASVDKILRGIDQFLFTIKATSIWRLEFFWVLLKAGTVKRIELKNHRNGCFTE